MLALGICIERRKTVVNEYDGRVPAARSDLLSLPGIGEYTAGAILSLAYGQREPVLDGNVKRVFSRLADIAEPIDHRETLAKLWEMAHAVVEMAPDEKAGVVNEALMELGAMVCTPSNPRCSDLPCGGVLYGFCERHATSAPCEESPKTHATL